MTLPKHRQLMPALTVAVRQCSDAGYSAINHRNSMLSCIKQAREDVLTLRHLQLCTRTGESHSTGFISPDASLKQLAFSFINRKENR